MRKRNTVNGILLVFILLSVLATIKICFLNVNTDEEYAITLSCRILSEDRMFLDIWEPHQTSGFLAAGLCWIYRTITGTMEYMLLYLRICGVLLQAAVSVFLYRTLKLSFSRLGAFTAAFFFFNTLPKQIQMPEFSNMLVWFSVLTMLCFFRACYSKRGRLWIGAGGVFLCGLVLAYPSCILAVPVCFVCLWKLRRKTFGGDAAVLFAVCGFLGVSYIAFFLSHMSFSQLLDGLRQMTTDSYHSASFLQRLGSYGREILSLLPHFFGILLLAGLLFYGYRLVSLKRGAGCCGWQLFFCCVLCVSFAEQLLIWLKFSPIFHYPLLHFYFLYGIGIGAYGRKRFRDRPQYRALFWLGSVWGGSVWLAALLITNTTISVTGSYLMCGLIPAILLLTEEPEPCPEKGEGIVCRLPVLLTVLGLLGTTLFAKGFLVCMNQGWLTNALVVRQKNLSGPAKGIYSIYMDGYQYNAYAEMMEGQYTAEDSLLYVGQHSLYYLVTECRIAVHSTISTPTFDRRLPEYWSAFPEHYPTLVVLDLGYAYPDEIEYVKNILNLEEPLIQNDLFQVYRTGDASR